MRSLVAVGAMFGATAPALAQSPPPDSAAVVEAEAQQPAQPAQPAITDATITEGIKAKLQESPTMRRAQVTIASNGGYVTLVGTVPSEFARDEILEAARSTPGVVSIDNQLRLDISSPSAPTRN